MRSFATLAALLLLSSAASLAAQGPLRIDPGFTGFGTPTSPQLDLAPPAPELPREAGQAAGLRLGAGASLAPSTLDQLDVHDPHRLLERGLPGDGGQERGLAPLLPERFGATVTVPF